jgi:type IV secretion system protein VirD4
MVMEMIRAGQVKENDDDYESPLDILFSDLEKKNPEHIALKYYRAYHSGAAQTLKSIQISLVARLEKFNLPSLAGITQTDEMRLDELGSKPGVIFAIIPDNDVSFNFIVGMLYTQLFQQLYRQAGQNPDGRLKRHVHFIMDEFANCCLPDSFDTLLSTMRSREISVSIIIQNLAQLKALFEKKWESITGNCDELLYLGGNEQGTHKYISELLGKETIDTNTYGQNKGRQGSFTKNDQTQARDLMTPDEVRMLDNRYAILFIRGENPVMDLKYDLLKHPNVGFTADGGREPYVHGKDTDSLLSISLVGDEEDRSKAIDIDKFFTEGEEPYALEVQSFEEIED